MTLSELSFATQAPIKMAIPLVSLVSPAPLYQRPVVEMAAAVEESDSTHPSLLLNMMSQVLVGSKILTCLQGSHCHRRLPRKP